MDLLSVCARRISGLHLFGGAAWFDVIGKIFMLNNKGLLWPERRVFMETRVAIMGIIIEDTESVKKLNELLHEYGEYIIGRMGIPYREKGIHIVSIAVDAPQDKISAMSGKIGKLAGISVKTAYSNVITHE